MALPIWSFVRVQAPNGTLLGVLSAAVFFLLSHDLPTGPLVAWTVGVGVVVSCAATLAGAVVLRRSRCSVRSRKRARPMARRSKSK
jgi:4-hydroxybenzoate polyprenyltransferase